MDQVWDLILEHAVKNRYHTLTEGILKKRTGRIRLPDIYQVIYCLEKICLEGRQDLFELAVQLIEMVYQMDNRICSFKVYSKLLLGIKMKFLLENLKVDDADTEVKLTNYLPALGPGIYTVGSKENSQHQKCVNSFREFFLPLVNDKILKDKYFKEEYETEFGEDFITSIKRLLNNFIMQLIQHLPHTRLEVLFGQKLDIQGFKDHKEMQKLLEFVQGIDVLKEEELLQFLEVIDEKTDESSLVDRSIKVSSNNSKHGTSSIRSPKKPVDNERHSIIFESNVLSETSAVNNFSTVTEHKDTAYFIGVKNSNIRTLQSRSENELHIESSKYKTRKQGAVADVCSMPICHSKGAFKIQEMFDTDSTKKGHEAEDKANDNRNSVKKQREYGNLRVAADSETSVEIKTHQIDKEKTVEAVNTKEQKIYTVDEKTASPIIKRTDIASPVIIPETLKQKCKRKLNCQSMTEGDNKKIKESVSPQAKKTKSIKEYTAEIWKSPQHFSSESAALGLCPVSSVAHADYKHSDKTSFPVHDEEFDDFPVIPPSNTDPDSDIELTDFEDVVSFNDGKLTDTCIPTLENFRLIYPVKLCVIKLFGRKDGIYS